MGCKKLSAFNRYESKKEVNLDHRIKAAVAGLIIGLLIDVLIVTFECRNALLRIEIQLITANK